MGPLLGSLGFNPVPSGRTVDGVLVLHVNDTKVGTLVRVDTSPQAAMYRLTVKASDPATATAFAAVLEPMLRNLGNSPQEQQQQQQQGGGAVDLLQQQQQPAGSRRVAQPAASHDPVLDIFASL